MFTSYYIAWCTGCRGRHSLRSMRSANNNAQPIQWRQMKRIFQITMYWWWINRYIIMYIMFYMVELPTPRIRSACGWCPRYTYLKGKEKSAMVYYACDASVSIYYFIHELEKYLWWPHQWRYQFLSKLKKFMCCCCDIQIPNEYSCTTRW